MNAKQTLCYFELRKIATGEKKNTVVKKITDIDYVFKAEKKLRETVLDALVSEGLIERNGTVGNKQQFTLLDHPFLHLPIPQFAYDEDDSSLGERKLGSLIYVHLQDYLNCNSVEEASQLLGVTVTVIESFNRKMKHNPLIVNSTTKIEYKKFSPKKKDKVITTSKATLVEENIELKNRITTLENRIFELESKVNELIQLNIKIARENAEHNMRKDEQIERLIERFNKVSVAV